MAMPVPQGFTSITPHIIVDGGTEMLEFYQAAFGAKMNYCTSAPENLLMHAEMTIGNAIIMLGSNQWGEHGHKSPKQLGGCSCYIKLYVADTDVTFKNAIAAGAEEIMQPADMFWGERHAQVRDPSGHIWSIATHQEELTDEEIALRSEQWLAEISSDSEKQ